MAKLVRISDYRRPADRVAFDRAELKKILAIYADRVASGEWRDYAIDHRPNMAAFAVFRSCYEWPLFVIAKLGGGSHRQGNFVVTSGPRRLIEGRSIDEVLAVFDRKLKPV
ncbi:MAG TPA: DUF2794 domain-containing protein [Alphaproteobacteria bacterium]